MNLRCKTAPGLKTVVLLVVIALSIGAAVASRVSAEELLRIRVENRTGGLVEVSTDGRNYSAVGKVLRPASGCIEGFGASCYISCGKVAATAVHGVRIKTGEEPCGSGKPPKPLMISLVPFEFATTPKGFGGHIPHESGIYTDIPAGKSIFRNLAPYVGDQVFLQRGASLIPLPDGYSPSEGDVLVIIVSRPDKKLREIRFENKPTGKVIEIYTDGSSRSVTMVEKPVEGVGRYDGTSYTGRGRINTNHPGVLTISTAPLSPAAAEGVGPERRGGFQIVPSYHALSQPSPMPSAMIVGPAKPSGPVIEGKEPLFADYIGLAWDPLNESHSFLTQVRIDDGPWESVPEVVGKVDNAFTAAGLNEYFRLKGTPREVHEGVTDIRILFPSKDRDFYAAEVARSAAVYAVANATTYGEDSGAVSGQYSVRAPFWDVPRDSVVTFFVDGKLAKISGSPPYQLEWNTHNVANGEHVIDIRAVDSEGNLIKTATVKLTVRNS